MKILFAIGTGSFIGGIFRYLLSQSVQSKFLSAFPFGTLVVNLTGCFLIGIVFGWSERSSMSQEWRLFIATGLLGGFTIYVCCTLHCCKCCVWVAVGIFRLFTFKTYLIMENNPGARLLRIFIGESDKAGHETLYETIVYEAKKQGLSGATVTRGIMGFGADSKVHSAKFFEISSDLPMVIEVVDTEEKIREFTKTVERLLEESKSGGLITIEKAEVIRYKAGK
jgi:protein CrcB